MICQMTTADWATLIAQVAAAVFTAVAALAAARSAGAMKDTVQEMRSDRLTRQKENVSNDLVKVSRALRSLAMVEPPPPGSEPPMEWQQAIDDLRTALAGCPWDLFESQAVVRWKVDSDSPEELGRRIATAREEVMSFIEFERTVPG
jgi:hypothetical protein